MTTRNIYELAQTWDNGAVAFTGIGLDVTDTASASDSLLMDLQVGGTSRFSVTKGAGFFATANLIEQYNGAAGQTFNIYNTYTGAGNYERGFIKWNSGVFEVGVEANGTGTSRNLRLLSSSQIPIHIGGASRWTIVADSIYPSSAATCDVGRAANPIRNLFLRPSASLTPSANGDLCIQATNNTTLTFKLKGSDGTVRSGTVALS